jgi:hypothetical protein
MLADSHAVRDAVDMNSTVVAEGSMEAEPFMVAVATADAGKK